MIYLDTSALVKLVFEEPESAGLVTWLATRPDAPKISSDLSMVELLRTCRRIDDTSLGDAAALLGGIDLVPIDRAIVERAAVLAPRQLRSLDAIHLASAMSIQADLTTMVAYDTRLCAAAADAGIDVSSPT
ncbi:MAG: type II toxin-antitoxin system VapC family toxin [Actinomycetota bacterium]|nr:type II toxin-antitoxin system VapC family toxin [Actinomycetota bacterium]